MGEVILKGAGIFHIPALSLPLGRQMASLTGRWQRKWKAYWKRHIGKAWTTAKVKIVILMS